MTKHIQGAEIFAEGEWNGIKFSGADLDGIVSSFDALGLAGKVPLKLGHEGDDPRSQAAQLALGWVTRVYRQGKKLLADFSMPDKAHALVGDGFLRYVSVELLRDVRASTREIPWVLDAVALLGTDQPAVGILKDLQALTMARVGDSFPHSGRSAFARADLNYQSMENVHMAEDTGNAIKELADQLATLRLDLNKAQAQITAKDATITELKGVSAKFTVLQADVAKDKRDAHRKSIVDLLEAAVKSDDIQPKIREAFTRTYGVDDDEAVMRVTLEDAKNFVSANPNPYKKVKDKINIVSLARATDDVPAGTTPGDEIRMRAEALLREQGKVDYTSVELQNAVLTLFKTNPQLGQSYVASVNKIIDHPSVGQ